MTDQQNEDCSCDEYRDLGDFQMDRRNVRIVLAIVIVVIAAWLWWLM